LRVVSDGARNSADFRDAVLIVGQADLPLKDYIIAR
jgi:hypothetical protein